MIEMMMKTQRILDLQVEFAYKPVVNPEINELLEEGWELASTQPFKEKNMIVLEIETQKIKTQENEKNGEV